MATTSSIALRATALVGLALLLPVSGNLHITKATYGLNKECKQKIKPELEGADQVNVNSAAISLA